MPGKANTDRVRAAMAAINFLRARRKKPASSTAHEDETAEHGEQHRGEGGSHCDG